MRRYSTTLTVFVFILSVIAIAYAGHDHMVIPYESQALGYRTTMPLPSAGDLRNHFLGHMPYKKWEKWPGKGEMYEGTEPHGAYLTVYVNDIAFLSIKKSKGMDNNSIILKENYTSDKKLSQITVMYKVKGFNPEDGDWFWAKYDSNFDIIGEGKLKACIGCHGQVKSNDYIYTGKVTGN